MQLQTLAQAVRNQREAALIHQAETIRDWRPGRERTEQAMIHVRLALWEQGIGRISSETQHRIYSVLNFVMPADATFVDEPTPMAELEPEADSEAAYYEQLERQSCPDCGDGRCPIEVDAQSVTLPDKTQGDRA
jgi:hypothetical protein